MKIFESDIKNMVKKALSLLMENAETNNINAAKQYLKSNGHKQDYGEIIEKIRTDIENIRLGKYKFLLGGCIYYLNGSLNDEEIAAKFNQTLSVMTRPEYIDKYPREIGVTVQQLINDFSDVIKNELENDKTKSSEKSYIKNTEYQIVPINSFEEAEKYGVYTSWCVTHSRNMFSSYTSSRSKFYFCLKNGFENIKPNIGQNAPLDEYGLSMIAVCVRSDGSLRTCTCRWNHDNGGNDNIMNVEELEKLFGCNFYETFIPIDTSNTVGKIKEILNNGGKVEEVLNLVDFYEIYYGSNNKKYCWIEYDDISNFIINGKLVSEDGFDEIGDDDIECCPLWVYQNARGYNFLNKNGKLLSKRWFSDVTTFENGLAIVTINGGGGNQRKNILRENGTFVFRKWPYSIERKDNLILVRKSYNSSKIVLRKDGTILSKTEVHEIEKFVNGYARVLLSYYPRQYNFMSEKDGSMLFENNLSTAEMCENVRVWKIGIDGVGYNIMSTNYKILSKEWFYGIGRFTHACVALVESNKGFNYLTSIGELLLKKWCELARSFGYNTSDYQALAIINGKTCTINDDAEISPQLWWDEEIFEYSDDVYFVEIKNYGYNVVLRGKKFLSKTWFDKIYKTDTSNPTRVFIAGIGYNFVSPKGKFLSKTWFYNALDFKNGFAIIKDRNGMCNFINKHGKYISDNWFNMATPFDENGYAKVYVRGKGSNVINKRGEFIENFKNTVNEKTNKSKREF